MIKLEIRFAGELNTIIVWKNNRAYHRLDGPAIIWSDETQFWYKEDKLHRDNDKPAITYPDGTKEWYKEGEFIKREPK